MIVLCLSNTSLKNTVTACPKIIGSETFIIVAFICKENNMFFSLASFICSSRKLKRAFLLITVASITSPSNKGVFSFKTVTSPALSTNSILTLPALETVTDFSLEKKSPFSIVDTCVLESLDQAPMECGFFLA